MSSKDLSSRNKGILFLMLSAFGFAMMSAFVKLAGDLPSFEKAFFRNIIAMIIAGIVIVKKRGSFFGSKKNQQLLILRSTLGTLGLIFNFYAIDQLVLSDASMLNKLSPFFVIIFSALFLREKVNFKQFISVMIAFIGALFIIKPSFSLDVIPMIIGTLGGVFAGAAYTCVRALGGKEHSDTVVFYFSFFSSIVTFPLMMMSFKPMTLLQFIYLLGAGTFAAIGQYGITIAYKYAPGKEISIFDYTNIIFSATLSLILFGILPDKWSILGYCIIFAASYYMFRLNNKLDKEKS